MKKQRFASEAHLVRSGRRAVRAALRDIGGRFRTRCEVRAPGGVADLVLFAYGGRRLYYVVAVEFKLGDWRRALRQAFRHRNYVNEAYVVLDDGRGMAAIEHREVFRSANVGLATVDRADRVRVWCVPEPALPFSPGYAGVVAERLLVSEKRKVNDLRFVRSVRGGSRLAALRGIWGMEVARGMVDAVQSTGGR